MLASYASHNPVYFIDNYIYIKIYFNFLCVCVHHMYTGVYGGQKTMLYPLELQLHVVVSYLTRVLRTKLRSSARATARLLSSQ